MIGLVVLGALVPASAAGARVVDPISVSASTAVPSGATRSLTLTCPGTAVALHGAASFEPGSDSIPGDGPSEWRFRFTTPSGEPDRRVRAVLRCVRLQLPPDVRGVRLRVGTVRRPDVVVVAGATRRVRLTCQRGMVPTGFGIERQDAGGSIAVAAAAPTRRGFRFRLENTGRAGASATPYMRCLKRTQRAQTGERHSFATRVARFEDTGASARHSCRRSEYSLATGVSLDPSDDVILTKATPAGRRGGRWSFSRSAQARTTLVCLSRRTRF